LPNLQTGLGKSKDEINPWLPPLFSWPKREGEERRQHRLGKDNFLILYFHSAKRGGAPHPRLFRWKNKRLMMTSEVPLRLGRDKTR